ncbi:tetratricopeptide repeat protein [Patescibacteria group bacterium]
MTTILILSVAALLIIFVRRYLISTKGIYLERLLVEKSKSSKGLLKAFHSKNPSKKEVAPEDKGTEIKILYTKAMALFDNGDLDSAKKHLEEIIELDAEHREANLKLGLIYLKREAFDKAENIYRKLIKTTDDDPVFYSNLGCALYEQKKFDEALDSYLKSINLDSSRPARYLSTAEVYRALSQPLKAEEMYKMAVDLEPSNTDFLLTFANFEIELGKMSQAKYYLRQTLKADPHNQLAKEMLIEVEGA